MRQLVTVRTISELVPIKGADRIELAKVDGWQCIVQKGEFVVDDLGLYFEIDSILPSDDERFAFLEPRKFRIKTMRMRKVLSQGLLMPMTTMTEEECLRWRMAAETGGDTLTEILRVQKYEPPMPIGGEQKGNFPTHLVPKTDQERIQNIPEVLEGRMAGEFEITEKLDGTSLTCWYHNDEFTAEDFADPLHGEMCRSICVGVASRNWEMKRDDDNVYARLFNELELEEKLHGLGRNIAVQGEVIGPRIQDNKYKRGTQEFYVFDIYDIDARSYLSPAERHEVTAELGLLHVPVLDLDMDLDFDNDCIMTLDTVLDFTNGKSKLFDTLREGLVFKEDRGSLTFKSISNNFLLKHE